MTNDEHEQVVELLRCAADLGLRGRTCPLTEAARRLEMQELASVADAAIPGREKIEDLESLWQTFGLDCLEAAQRIEEGSWP